MRANNRSIMETAANPQHNDAINEATVWMMNGSWAGEDKHALIKDRVEWCPFVEIIYNMAHKWASATQLPAVMP